MSAVGPRSYGDGVTLRLAFWPLDGDGLLAAFEQRTLRVVYSSLDCANAARNCSVVWPRIGVGNPGFQRGTG